MKLKSVLLAALFMVICMTTGTLAAPRIIQSSNTDFFGVDYDNFDLTGPQPEYCGAACARSSLCMSYAYVKPGVQGPNARCWLKSAVPSSGSDTCCTSGKKTQRFYMTQVANKDLLGSDYHNFDITAGSTDADRVKICIAECAKSSICVAYTYGKPGLFGNPNAHCWLKNAVPGYTGNSMLISGVKKTVTDQAASFSITHWNGNCGGSTRTWWDDMCMAWRKKMGSKGWRQWWENYEWVTNPKFADPAEETWGEDTWHLEAGDAALICTHGGHGATTGWSGSMHTDVGHGCNIDTTQMRVGPASRGKVRFLHLSSCNSIHWDERGMWWAPAAGRVHVVTGFHGLMYIGSKYVDEYKDLANKGFSQGVGKLWVNEMHHVDHWYNSWKTVCPVALGFGETAQQSSSALDEKYTDRWPDRAPWWMTTRWKSGCNPDGAGALPN